MKLSVREFAREFPESLKSVNEDFRKVKHEGSINQTSSEHIFQLVANIGIDALNLLGGHQTTGN